MMSKVKFLWVGGFLLVVVNGLFAQKQVPPVPEDIRKYIPTENLDSKKENSTYRDMPREKGYSLIYKESTEGILYGNPCALEETRKMGFEYIVEKESLPGSMLRADAQWNNFIVNLKLIFTRSPFWKLILNKRLKECRQKTGDIVG